MMRKIILISLIFSSTTFSQLADRGANSGSVVETSSHAPEAITGTAALDEGFDDITNLPGWVMDNQSNPVGISGWFQGNAEVFAAQAGSVDSYIGANFNNTSGSDICNWLVMPDLGELTTVSFWTRTGTGNTFPDRMFVVHSPTGGVNTGDCFTDFGDFTNSLVEINPALATGGYPDDWVQFTAVVNGTGRVAFVYFVADGGPKGFNSNFIGIDSVVASTPVSDVIFLNGFE